MQVIMELDAVHEAAVHHCQDQLPHWFKEANATHLSRFRFGIRTRVFDLALVGMMPVVNACWMSWRMSCHGIGAVLASWAHCLTSSTIMPLAPGAWLVRSDIAAARILSLSGMLSEIGKEMSPWTGLPGNGCGVYNSQNS